MQIHVREEPLHGQRSHALDVEPTDTIRSLKDVIGRMFSLDDEDLELRILVIDNRNLLEVRRPPTLEDGKDLFDFEETTSLRDCRIKDGDILRLGYKGPFEISLESYAYSRPYTIEVSCTDTILDLKEKVEAITEEPVTADNFPNIFLCCQEDRSLLSFGIYKLNPHGVDDLRIYRNRENVLPADPFPSQVYLDRGHHDLPPIKKLQIAIEFPNMPWRFPLMYDPTDTIGTVRDDIVRRECKHDQLFGQRYIHDGDFVLFFRRKKLEDHSLTLGELGIAHMDSIQVYEDAEFEVQLLPRLIERLSVVSVRCYHTIGQLKEKISEVSAYSWKEILLVYNKRILDDEEKFLIDYGIAIPVKYDESFAAWTPENDPFWGRPSQGRFFVRHRFATRAAASRLAKFQIAVNIPYVPLPLLLTCEPTDTICTVKNYIMNKYLINGVTVCNAYIKERMFILFFGAMPLGDESITLNEYGIRHLDTVQLFDEQSFCIPVCAPNYGLPMHKYIHGTCFCTVGNLKAMIRSLICASEGEELYLKCGEWYLDDEERHLAYYGIIKPTQIPLGVPLVRVAASREGLNAREEGFVQV